jgi:hypothetical protein
MATAWQQPKRQGRRWRQYCTAPKFRAYGRCGSADRWLDIATWTVRDTQSAYTVVAAIIQNRKRKATQVYPQVIQEPISPCLSLFRPNPSWNKGRCAPVGQEQKQNRDYTGLQATEENSGFRQFADLRAKKIYTTKQTKNRISLATYPSPTRRKRVHRRLFFLRS